METTEHAEFKKISQLEGKRYVDCSFLGCNFSGTDLSNIHFQDCLFHSCNLTAVRIENVRFQGVRFVESKLMGVNFTRSDSTFLELGFKKCLIRGCNFTDLKLKKTIFFECVVKECHFVQCDLERGDFRLSDLEGTLFHHTRLCNANFLEAYNFSIDPLQNELKGAKFSKQEALSLLIGLGIVIE